MENSTSGVDQSEQPAQANPSNISHSTNSDIVQKNNGSRKYIFVILLLLLIVAVLSFSTYYFFDQHNKLKAAVSQSNKVGSMIVDEMNISTPTLLSPTSTVVESPSDDVDIDSILNTVVSGFTDYEFVKINPRVFDFQVDASTKKVVTGIGYTTDLSEDNSFIEKEIFDNFIKLGFIENQYNAAGPDFGAVRYGLERDGVSCIIQTGYSDPTDPEKRVLSVDCGNLE